MAKLSITLCDPNDHTKEFILDFHLFDTKISRKWQAKVKLAQLKKYPIDDPQRFYGLDGLELETAKALKYLNDCIDVINSHRPLVDRKMTDVNDSDTLNYLHHIFEKHHGLLDKQNSEYWQGAPPECRKALADLNVFVHRVENVLYGNPSRFCVTYWQLPKVNRLTDEDFQSFTNFYNFGGLYLNYVEIGKTLEDLHRDNDQYIDADAFKPWDHYSADFTVKLYDIDYDKGTSHLKSCEEYYQKHLEFFQQQGYDTYTDRLKPGKVYVGQLLYDDRQQMIDAISQHQYVKSVDIIE
jgi:hypothetical protein